MSRKTVFLTGATGNMGWAGFQELYSRKDRFNIRLLARDTKKNRRLLSPYLGDSAVTVVWGDLMCYEDVFAGVTGADYVLHVGGMVSPAADYYPEKTLKVNVGSAENVVNAVLAQPDASEIRVVYIGSVAQYGDRNPPHHWGGADDVQTPAEFDMYALSKIKAEEVFAKAGFRRWVSLRQSGILYPGILKVLNPTAFHVPVGGVLEWATIEDSGRLLAQVCEDWVPEEFWNNAYNISSGPQYRMTNYEFETRLLNALGLPGPEKVFEPQWFALKNFHGMWYRDSDKLENILHFRANTPVDDYFAALKSRLPWYYSLAFLAPAWAVKMFMKPYAFAEGLGTQWWVENDEERFLAYYGSREAYDSIRSWDDVRPQPLEKDLKIRVLDILEETMADGPGFRTSIYCAGCAHHCPGCHNPQSWDFQGGREMTIDEILDIVKSDELSDVTFSGGDPLYQVEAFTELARRIKEETGKNIWCYTGFTYEEILADNRLKMILPYIDTLVDGPFVEDLRDADLHFRGSSNQRIIHLTEQEKDEIEGTVPVMPYK